ncbi:MAG TPA: kelch repeat-containing protein [Bryobacteraceae bacterium]|nr:kelch repeat-containing protein [Bryobacteraceae bacterium]
MRTRLAFLAAVLGACLASRAMAQSPGSFAPTGSMTTPRMGHTATLLDNGKVLIAGGYQNVPGGQHCEGALHGPTGDLECVTALNSAELYDPATGTFSPTGNMTGSGLGHTATLLPSGKVLIHWGRSAEIYDPSSGLFSSIDGVFPGGALATLLHNGKVLINGPWPAAVTGFPALLYDPSDGTFLPTGDYAGTPGFPGTAAVLPDGRVLVAGSLGCCSDMAQTEIYDPASDTFSLTAPIFTQSNGTTTVLLLNNGKVLAIAGWDVNDDSATPIGAGLYDPTAGAFQIIGNMTMARADYTATLLTDGTVFIAGGDFAPSSTEVYNPTAQRFSATVSMLMPREAHTATLLPDGRVLLAGGLPDSPATTATAELYTPPSLTPSPALFSLSGDGTGQGAIWYSGTGRIASSANPATAGDVLSMYTTSLFEGGVIPPQIAIGGLVAEVLFFGDAPGYPGYYQVNFRVPNGVAPGLAVSVRLTYLGRPSNEVTIGVR